MEDYITLAEAADLLPTRPSPSTIYRWCARGIYVRGVDQVVHMRFVRIGRKMFTTADWVEEFVHRLTATTMAQYEEWMNRHKPGSRSRLQRLAEADEVLRKAGI